MIAANDDFDGPLPVKTQKRAGGGSKTAEPVVPSMKDRALDVALDWAATLIIVGAACVALAGGGWL